MGLLELIGASRRGSGNPRLHFLLSLTPLFAAVAITAAGLPAARAADAGPRPADLRCIEGCAGRQTAAVGSTIAITGNRLSNVAEVDFRRRSGWIAAIPAVTRRHRLIVGIPSGAMGGHPRVVARYGRAVRIPKLLRIVSQAELPGRSSFELLDSEVGPKHGFVDDGRTYRLRYRFRAYGPRMVRVKLVHSGDVVRRWKSETSFHTRRTASSGAACSLTAVRLRPGITGSRSNPRTTGRRP